MKKILGIAAILVLTAGISHAGDSFSIVIGPHGFGFSISGDHGRWQPRHGNYRAEWRPAPYRRPYRQPRQRHHWIFWTVKLPAVDFVCSFSQLFWKTVGLN